MPKDGHTKDLALADSGLEGLALRIQTRHSALAEQDFAIKPWDIPESHDSLN